MPSLVENLTRLAMRAARTTHGERVTYRRGSQAVDLTAMPATPLGGLLDPGSGAAVEWEGFDWFIAREDLVLSGELAEPQKGDQIVRNVNEVYDVLPPPGGRVWEWVGPYQNERRIHTKLSEWPI